MDNAEEVFQMLDEFSKRKPKTIPQELNDYLVYVAQTGDPLFQWPLVKTLFKEKLISVITDFYESAPGIDVPHYPNVDPFNYDLMKNSLLERLDSFYYAPFTIQRICELLTSPRKQYNRIDKFMRAVEKNILVVSTVDPGMQRHIEQENADPVEPVVNGSDNNSDYNVDVEMEDVSWKENTENGQKLEPQPSSSEQNISVDEHESKLENKQDVHMESSEQGIEHSEHIQKEITNGTETITPIIEQTQDNESKPQITSNDLQTTSTCDENDDLQATNASEVGQNLEDSQPLIESKCELGGNIMLIPEIKIDNADTTEQRLKEQSSMDKPEAQDVEVKDEKIYSFENNEINDELKLDSEQNKINIEESISEPINTESLECDKAVSEASTSSEENSTSSDNMEYTSNSPKMRNELEIDCNSDSPKMQNESEAECVSNSPKLQNEAEPDCTSNSPKFQNESEADCTSNSPKLLNESEVECNRNTPKTEIESDSFSDSSKTQTESAESTNNLPKHQNESEADIREDSGHSDHSSEGREMGILNKETQLHKVDAQDTIQTDKYSISDVSSELIQPVKKVKTEEAAQQLKAECIEKMCVEVDNNEEKSESNDSITN